MSAYPFTLLSAATILAMVSTKLWLATRQVRFVAAHRGAVLLITSAVEIPCDYVRQFGIEGRFGFNRMTRKLFFANLARNTAVGTLLGLPLLFVVLWLMNRASPLWWLWTWIVWVAFQMLVLYPSFIAPLFNKFEPLGDESLRAHRGPGEALRLRGQGPVRDGRQPPSANGNAISPVSAPPSASCSSTRCWRACPATRSRPCWPMDSITSGAATSSSACWSPSC